MARHSEQGAVSSDCDPQPTLQMVRDTLRLEVIQLPNEQPGQKLNWLRKRDGNTCQPKTATREAPR
jgi:hypothetical protein